MMKLKETLIFTALSFFVPSQIHAVAPAKRIAQSVQTDRDKEKYQILNAEISKQQQEAENLKQEKAVALQEGRNTDAASIDQRLAEIDANIKQLQQELGIQLNTTPQAESKTVMLTPAIDTDNKPMPPPETQQAPTRQGKWWDLYNRH